MSAGRDSIRKVWKARDHARARAIACALTTAEDMALDFDSLVESANRQSQWPISVRQAREVMDLVNSYTKSMVNRVVDTASEPGVVRLVDATNPSARLAKEALKETRAAHTFSHRAYSKTCSSTNPAHQEIAVANKLSMRLLEGIEQDHIHGIEQALLAERLA